MAEKFEDRVWEGIEGGLTAAAAHMEPEEVPEESLLVAYILLLLVELDGSVTGAVGDLELGGGTPQSDLLPQMMFDCCCCCCCGCAVLAVARPLPTLESPVNEAEKPESKLLLLIALLVLLRLRSSWMNEFIAAMESVAVDGGNGGDAGEQVLLLRLVEDGEAAYW